MVNYKIDYSSIENTLKNMSIKLPDNLGFIRPLRKSILSLLQLNCLSENEIIISKYYVTVSPFIEVVLNSEHNIVAVNINDRKNNITSLDVDGNKITSYYIDKTVLTDKRSEVGVIKENGDAYYPYFYESDNHFIESIRQELVKRHNLLGYSHKIDGRINMYLIVNKTLNYEITQNNYTTIEGETNG